MIMGFFNRRILGRILTLTLALVLLLATGCSFLNKQITDDKQVQGASSINIGSAQEPDTANPLTSRLIAVHEIGRLVFSGLVMSNEKGEWFADLASAVPSVTNGDVSTNGLVVRYKLRPNVKWHDGTVFSSRDVVFTYEYIMNNRTPVISREGYDKIASVTAPDDQTVIVQFKENYPRFLSLFSTIVPHHILSVGAEFDRHPVGTGPFRLTNWRQGDSLIFEANKEYHFGKPALDSIIYKIVPDRQIVLSQLKVGEIDILDNIEFSQLDALQANTGVNPYITASLTWEHLDLNLDHPIFRDERTRKAISLALDRAAITETVLKGVGKPTFTDIHPLSKYFNPEWKNPGRNLNTARDLLAQVGWKPGADGILIKDGIRFSVTILVPKGFAPRETAADIIGRQLRELGIETRIQTAEPNFFFNETLRTRKFDAVIFAWVGDLEPDFYDNWHSKRIPSMENRLSGKNFAGLRNVEMDYLLDEAKLTSDPEARKRIFQRIQEILSSYNPTIPLYYRPSIAAAKRGVANFRPNDTGATNYWNAWEWKWQNRP